MHGMTHGTVPRGRDGSPDGGGSSCGLLREIGLSFSSGLSLDTFASLPNLGNDVGLLGFTCRGESDTAAKICCVSVLGPEYVGGGVTRGIYGKKKSSISDFLVIYLSLLLF
jgi:hypothetical protein